MNRILFFCCTIFVTSLVCNAWGQNSENRTAGEVILENKTYKTKSGKSGEYQVGTLFVKENRSDPNSRIIGLGFSIHKAQDPVGPPVFFLPGGPGSSFLNGNFPFLAEQLWDDCDVICVDQRGFSRRGSFLKNIEFKTRKFSPDATLDDRVKEYVRYANAVVEHYRSTEIDLRGYNALECIEDVNELRIALGYEKIALRGQSFGSQWSFGIIRKYPEIVERALLTGVEPLNNAYDMPSHVMAAVHRIWESLDNDPRFQPYLPEGGMREAAEAVISRMENDPIKVFRKKKSDPVIILGPTDFPYNNPRRILELYHNHLDSFARPRFSGVASRTLVGPLIDSSLGVTDMRKEKLWNDPSVRFTSRANFASYLATADIWPSPDVGDEFRTPIKCETPVVFVNGDWDVKTPVENMLEIAPYFPNSHSIIVHQAGHGTLHPKMQEQHPKLIDQLKTFLIEGKMDGLPKNLTVESFKRFPPPQFELEKK